MKRRILIFNCFVFYAAALWSQPQTRTYIFDAASAGTERQVDISHLTARLAIDPYDTLVAGEAAFRFRPVREQVDSIKFYIPDIQCDKITLDGKPAKYRAASADLVIYPEGLKQQQDYLLEIRYSAKPKYDLFFIGWNEPGIRDNKQVWAHRPFHWLPYADDRLTVDMYITFDGDFMVFSNGIRESVTVNNDGTKTWHYRMAREHPFFSTALVIGNYDYRQSETAGGIPLELWYYPWQQDHFEPTYRYTEQMFDFLGEELGYPYPYELYREAPVEDYLYGAMETTTSTIFGDYMHVDDRAFDGRNYVNVNIHELVHQWFGNCLSHLRGDVWLTESFATYYAKLFERAVFGEDYYQQVRLQEWEETMAASALDGYPVGHSKGGRARWYPKGSLVLDMMRYVMGDNDFRAAIRHYLEKNAFSEVETAELLEAVRESTGYSLQWFFEEWILRGGEPEYKIGYEEAMTVQGDAYTDITVEQVHYQDELVGLFRMPVCFEVYYEDGFSVDTMAWISEKTERVTIPNPGSRRVEFVVFDPGRKVLKKMQFTRSHRELEAQARKASQMIDRYDALVLLRDEPIGIKRELLEDVFHREGFHLMRGEALHQLGAAYDSSMDGIMREAMQSNDVYVRRALLESLDQVPASLRADYEELLDDISYINVEMALENLCASFPENRSAYLSRTADETGWRGRNIRIKWLEIAIGGGNEDHLGELIGYGSPRYEFETRINAFQALQRLNYLDRESCLNLIRGFLYWNYKVSNAARDVIDYFIKQERYRRILEECLDEPDFSAADREKVERLIR